MKYLKKFENNYEEEFEIGDVILCIDDSDTNLVLGGRYQVEGVAVSGLVLHLKGLSGQWRAFRFTKNPKHPVLLKRRQEKFGL